MPLFYFDLSNGTKESDEEGIELDSVEEARNQAVRLVGEMLRFDDRAIWDGEGLAVEVFDEARAPLFIVRVTANGPFPAS